MTTSPYFGLPFIAQQQATPEVTHNEALLLLQAVIGGALGLQNAPPGSPADGDVYIVGTSPTGAWTGRANCLALRYGGAWLFLPGVNSAGTPLTMGAAQEGLRIWRADLNALWVWTGSAWAAQAATEGGPFVAKAGDTMSGDLTVAKAAASTLLAVVSTVSGEATQRITSDQNSVQEIITRHSTNTNVQAFRRARGSAASPADIQSGDAMGVCAWTGWGGGAWRNAASIHSVVIAGTPSATDMESRLIFRCSAPATITLTEIARMEVGTGLSMFGANQVIDASRIFRLRSYTVGTLPASPAAGSFAYCSDETGGAVPVFGDGTNWRRVTDRAIAA